MNLTAQEIITRNAVTVTGAGERTVVLAHGFGCNQTMWRHFTPCIGNDVRLVLFDYTGFGASGVQEIDLNKYTALDGYAQDVIDVCDALGLQQVTFVGHSVSSMIGLIAAIERPDLFRAQVMICPSPCFLNDPPYQGGFEEADLLELIDLIDRNFLGWANYLAPVVMGQDNDPRLLAELAESFRQTAPRHAKVFAQATFLADCRPLLPKSPCPSLVFQSAADNLVSPSVGAFIRDTLPNCTFEVVEASGHCLHMTDPAPISSRLLAFMRAQDK